VALGQDAAAVLLSPPLFDEPESLLLFDSLLPLLELESLLLVPESLLW
jgi:hypothetical protein